MPIYQLDRREIKAEARELIRTGSVSPIKMTLLLSGISIILSLIESAADAVSGGVISGGFSGISVFSLGSASFVLAFVSILVSLVLQVLSAGYTGYCLGIHRRECMPYASLFDAFSFAGKVILLTIVQFVFVFLWSLLFVIPGIIASYRYAFAMMNLCQNPELGVMEALELSKRQTFGYKWQLFVLQLSFIGWSLLVLGIFLIYELLVAALLPDSFLGIMFGSLLLSVLVLAAQLYLTPYVELSVCGFYLRATAQPEEPQLPQSDWSSEG